MTVSSSCVVDVYGALDVESAGVLTIKSGATQNVAGTLSVTGWADFNGVTTLDGPTTLSDKLALSGSAAGICIRVGTVGDVNSTIDVSKDLWRVPRSLAAIRSYTLRSTTAPIPAEGQRLKVSRSYAAVSDAEFRREDSTLLGTLEYNATPTAKKQSITFVYTGGSWIVEESTDDATVQLLGSTYD